MLFVTAATVLAALFQVILAQDMKINTLTSPVECEPVQFTWQGGAPPYYLSLIPAGQPSAAAIKQFPVQNGNSMTWTVDLPSGTSFSSSLKDSTGAIAYSDIQNVQSGTDNSCLNGSSSTMATSSVSATSITSTDSSAASTNTATTATALGANQRGTSTTSSGSSSGSASGTGVHAVGSSTASSTGTAPTSSNAASLHASAGAIGIAGLLGLAGAALLG